MCMRFDSALDLYMAEVRAYRKPHKYTHRKRTIVVNSFRKTENRTICITLLFWKIEELPFFTNSVTCGPHCTSCDRMVAVLRTIPLYVFWHLVTSENITLFMIFPARPPRNCITFCATSPLFRHLSLSHFEIICATCFYGRPACVFASVSRLQRDANIHGHE